MDRQRLISVLALMSLGCADESDGRHAFDGPISSTWLEAGEGPFDEAISFVANSRNGTIVPIDLKHATLLGDQLASPFLQPRWVATGDERQLGELVAWAPDSSSISLWVADHVHQVLVEAPYVVGVDETTGEPQVMEPTVATGPDRVSANSTTTAEIVGLELAQGYTTTEDWRIQYDEEGDQWWVFGSRSGKQSTTVKTGTEWHTDNRELTFTIEGDAASGDRFELSTNTGIVEYDLGGYILDLERVPGTDLLLAAVWKPVAQTGDLVVWDMREKSTIGSVGLEDSGQPWKMALGAQEDGQLTVYAGHARQNVVQIIEVDLDSPETSTWADIPTTGPVSALAFVSHDGNELIEEESYANLFVATTDSSRVDVLDVQTLSWVDVNPHDGVVGGIELYSPVIGLSASRVPIKLQEEASWGARKDDRIVAVTTFDGSLMMFEGETGCLALEEEGITVPSSSAGEAVDFEDHGGESTPYLYQDPATGQSMAFPSCGGIARSEVWTLIYDGTEGNYTVEGSISGKQEGRAWEDMRYVSDNGEISMLILSGAAPTTDGDTFSMQVDDGVLSIDKVLRPGGLSSDALEQPAEPMVFDMEAGPSGGGWDEDRTAVHILLPVTNSDFVMRVNASAWETQVIWD